MVEPSQDHSTHFDVHAQDIQAHQQEPGVQPHDLLIHMEQAGGHMAQHLQALKGDPTKKAQVKQKEQQLQAMGKATDQLSQQVQEHAQSLQQGNGQNGNGQGDGQGVEGLAALAKVHGDIGLKAEKQKVDLALKARKQMVEEKLKDAKTAADIQRQSMQPQPQAAPQDDTQDSPATKANALANLMKAGAQIPIADVNSALAQLGFPPMAQSVAPTAQHLNAIKLATQPPPTPTTEPTKAPAQ